MDISFILFGVVAAVLVWGVVMYNRFVALVNRAKEAWADIDVQLKRRFDLIPNLVETVPQRSSNASRKDVDTSSFVTPAIQVRVPVLSANMDTVTEAAMAIAMARAGGLGIIHRFTSVEQQVRQIKQVKRSQGFVVDNPYAIGPDESISDATRAMQLHEVGGLVVRGANGRLVVWLRIVTSSLHRPIVRWSVR